MGTVVCMAAMGTGTAPTAWGAADEVCLEFPMRIPGIPIPGFFFTNFASPFPWGTKYLIPHISNYSRYAFAR